MKNNRTLSILLGLILLPLSSRAAITQTNTGNGDGDNAVFAIPGDNLLATSLASATRTGADDPDPREKYFNGGEEYGIDLSLLYDGEFGDAGSGGESVFPNVVSLTFSFDLIGNPGGFNLSSIQTYAGWDKGRDGQQYTVEYSTIDNPTSFLSLASIARFDNTNFPNGTWYHQGEEDEDFEPDTDYSATKVELTDTAGFLATHVAALRFNFNGVENGGTAYREFVVQGTAAVPEPSVYALFVGAAGLLAMLRRKKRG